MARRAPARAGSPELTHVDSSGRLQMVDVGDKPVTAREAVARGAITVSAAVQRMVRRGQVRKGNPLDAARLAGIMAAKRTSDIIPLCHPIALTHVDVDIAATPRGYRITATARTTAQTGVEMEALTAVSAAALTIYDMLKAADREMVIGEICLVEKSGGRSGRYRRSR
jgi:cyclic pyranopterin monophosphate synthase